MPLFLMISVVNDAVGTAVQPPRLMLCNRHGRQWKLRYGQRPVGDDIVNSEDLPKS